ncbi:flavodoxin-dependent (E)-4-hydroxy-3-methylbut-2-enyl-diphosphate synthase [Anaerotalea alkaliphila]|uniref:4-hydroxy-3-methylbut-2-en-1-yl diphosphate synthase (flavodoxin) n=1 Tax=Anaerotalea alkaliphila TaxID=2662126 RepID=A0A7X5HT34_9FIRM|nr:flavodoxin-dependent (E)-4-hydroxy-3-methylbut-2-enyl-diphosphate synthase [Anaerotalea alkaliphila]NDL66165.1 flavodoxin-dependent (E)-4-hydroxy-3-methylbut-2-enyl-diphosphate synthase [Anaerotalea alkaliphila]
MQVKRNETKAIAVGNMWIGGEHPVSIQSMTNTRTEDVEATVGQILALEEAGCQIVRVAVPTPEAARAIGAIKRRIHIPLVADIHFDHTLAILSVEQGADKIRINPGNLGGTDRLQAVVEACRGRGIPIRVGVNSGSLERELLARHGGPTPEALVESAWMKVRQIEDMGYDRMVVSIKSSDVMLSIRSYRLAAERMDYPLHLGITEAGTLSSGTVKSAVGLGVLLAEGVGNTIRVSLTGDPVEEVHVARQILQALDLAPRGVEIISCPTCGRTRIDLVSIAEEVERRTAHLKKTMKVAVMGCVVNGPGEAREADLGIAGGDGMGILFKKGKLLRKVKEEELVDALMEEILKEQDRVDR